MPDRPSGARHRAPRGPGHRRLLSGLALPTVAAAALALTATGASIDAHPEELSASSPVMRSAQQQSREQRLAHTGRPGEISYQQVGEIEVAVVGFAPYPWAQPLTDIPAARRLVEKAAANADVVIVTMHAGAEGTDHAHVRPGTETFLGENRGNVVAFSHAVVEAGADLVIGHGPHVLRGMEWYKGHLIAYSLGNFAGYRVFSLGGPLSVSGILRVTLRGDGGFDSGTLVPTRMVGAGMPALDPAESAHGIVRTLSKQDFGARAVKVSANGGLSR